jgi:GT2 family glycosyltransferase
MISVVTVNYKTKPYLATMLASLFRHHDRQAVEVFVVENASGDDLGDLEHIYPDVRFLKSNRNLGFAGGCNLAIREARGKYVVLVNPDIIFDSPALCQIAERMERDPGVGVGGVSLKNLDGSPQGCVWRFPTPLSQFLLVMKVPHIFPQIGPMRRWLMKDFDYTQTADVDQVMGAFFCIRRALLDDIGLLDDGFFMWYEEVDFCKRAKDVGWRVRYFADISARHKKGSSFLSLSTIKKQSMLRRSLRRYMRKHHGMMGWLLFTLPEPLYVVMAFLTSLLKPT